MTVAVDLGCEHSETALDESGRAIGVLARAASGNHVQPPACLHLGVTMRITVYQRSYGRGDGRQAVQTRPALSRVLTGQPPGDAGHLGQPACSRR
jgi:hypothetical protein